MNAMRRTISVLAVLGLVLGVLAALAGPAAADITAPANGAVLRGNATISASGASDGTLCFRADSPRTTLQLINSGGGVVFESVQGGTGAKSATIDTHNYPNGSYTARAIERNRSGVGWCSNNTRTTNRSVTIDNITQISYSGATEAPQNTSATVRATLTDPNLSGSVLANRTVTFSLSGGASVSANTNSNGVATASLPIAGPPRNATVTASFAATTHYKGSSVSTPFTVEKNPSTTTLVDPATALHGQPVTFTAQVARVNGTSNPGGTVQFTVDGQNLGGPVPVSSGQAVSPSTATLSTGNHTIGASYSGDGNLLASTATTKTQTIDKALTTTSLGSTGSPTVTGESVTFTATVAVSAGAGEPTGGVQFNVDGEPYGTAVPLDGDSAELTISNLRPGNHQVVATYNGNADFASSSSAELTHGVNRAETTVSLQTSNPDAVAGEPLTFTAEVDVVGPGAGDPTGVVQFASDGVPIGDPVPLNNGAATSPPTGLDAGSHTITADYQGDDDFAGDSDELTQEVAAAHTTTVVTTSPNPSVVGQPVTIKATVEPVAPATGVPAGAVQLTIDGVAGDFVTLADGEAEIVLADLSRGSHEITARYFSADPNFVTSTSEAATHTVNKAATSTIVDSSAPTSVFGQPVTFTAALAVDAPGAGAPSGTVTFTNGSTVIGTAPIGSATGFRASITTDALPVGQHAVVATYEGDDSFLGSSGSVSQRVQRAQTTTLVTSSANPSQSGQSVRFTAAISPVAPGAGDPGGTVRFTVNGANLGAAVAVVDGEATSAAFTSLSPGTYKIEATYSGDPRFVGSSGVLDQGNGQHVTKAQTAMTLESGKPASAYGEPVTFTATVDAVGPATGTPSGAVQFWDGDVLLGAVGLSPAGAGKATASFATASLGAGEHEIRATYVGNFNFEGQTATTSQYVGAVPTVVGVESDHNPATFGDDVTLTAVVTKALPAAGTPGGTVTFRSGDDVLGTADVTAVDGRRQASLTVSSLAVGTHEVTASYSGDDAFAPAESAPYLQQVGKAASTLEADVAFVTLGEDNIGRVRATLTGLDGEPLAGQELVFTATHPVSGFVIEICEAPPTGADGSTSCVADTMLPAFTIDIEGYDVRFEGNDSYLPATDRATWTVRQDQ